MKTPIRNIDSKPFSFSFGYHTYLSVSDICEVRIEGLETLDYLDNLSDRKHFTEQGDAITFESERELRGICGNIGLLEAPPITCHKCKSGVEHLYCTRNHSRPSKSVADHDMAQVKPRNNITVDSSCCSKYVEQSHPTRSGNTQNDTSVQKAKEWYKHDFLWGMFRRHHGKLRSALDGRVVQYVNIDDDVDMVGGELVGTVDLVIPKQSSDSNSAKIPRNFDLNIVAPVP